MHLKRIAFVCKPAPTLDKALAMHDLGRVNVSKAFQQHEHYARSLEKFDYTLLWRPAEVKYPDSVFVEDGAATIRSLIVRMRLRRKSRQGEEDGVVNILRNYFQHYAEIEPPGYCEGGDVLITKTRIYCGISKRTNVEGAEQLARFVKDKLGLSLCYFAIPASYLHLKGEVTFHESATRSGGDIITVSEEIAEHFADSGYKLIETPREERFGGNCISNKGAFLVHKGCTITARLLRKAGFAVRMIDLSEFAKIDGAMTCLSKLFSV